LAFKLHSPRGTITTRDQAEQAAEAGLIEACLNPFNGVLLARSVITSIGLPQKEMFLWGDEYEYFLRLKRAGIKVATVVDAHFFHPADRMQADYVRLLVKKFPVYYANNPLKDYLILRNQAYIVRKYRGWLGWLVHVARYLVFYWRLSGMKEFPKVFRASWHGARADFSHHQKLLQ
jgi:rhamnopyranosyl-N-acetylglucosaminyl-diphospho-decaprenol beta-1,3/1,4-galactofuranosyltransferase